jgi:hypothetical protein
MMRISNTLIVQALGVRAGDPALVADGMVMGLDQAGRLKTPQPSAMCSGIERTVPSGRSARASGMP